MNKIKFVLFKLSILFCVFLFSEKECLGSLADIVSASEIHGFLETRNGYRLQNDLYEKDMSVMDTRVQLEYFGYADKVDFKYKGDFWSDLITEKVEYDMRELWFFSRPSDFMDIKLGRQVLTWGTGDLVFLNDLFPKDWQSFFLGRDAEYLKAPTDAAKISLFFDIGNIDFVYVPKFKSDRYITGEYISHWNGNEKRISGQDVPFDVSKPDDYFKDDEISLRIYRNINNYEYALYGYFGYWKNPKGSTEKGIKTFPLLNVYGASVRGVLYRGIGNAEIAYYDSQDDKNGLDPLVPNSEMRYLIGYTQDISKDFNISLQYYIEYMLDYSAYRQNVKGQNTRHRARNVITLQITRLLMNQDLELIFSMYYSPTDKDCYLKPYIKYKYSDSLSLETGLNVFFGKDEHTFFAQFKNNTNLYTSIRYSF